MVPDLHPEARPPAPSPQTRIDHSWTTPSGYGCAVTCPRCGSSHAHRLPRIDVRTVRRGRCGALYLIGGTA